MYKLKNYMEIIKKIIQSSDLNQLLLETNDESERSLIHFHIEVDGKTIEEKFTILESCQDHNKELIVLISILLSDVNITKPKFKSKLINWTGHLVEIKKLNKKMSF